MPQTAYEQYTQSPAFQQEVDKKVQDDLKQAFRNAVKKKAAENFKLGINPGASLPGRQAVQSSDIKDFVFREAMDNLLAQTEQKAKEIRDKRTDKNTPVFHNDMEEFLIIQEFKSHVTQKVVAVKTAQELKANPPVFDEKKFNKEVARQTDNLFRKENIRNEAAKLSASEKKALLQNEPLLKDDPYSLELIVKKQDREAFMADEKNWEQLAEMCLDFDSSRWTAGGKERMSGTTEISHHVEAYKEVRGERQEITRKKQELVFKKQERIEKNAAMAAAVKEALKKRR